MARVVVLFGDLLLGSNVLGMLRAAGHEARLAFDPARTWPDGADVLVVDLTSEKFDGVEYVVGLRDAGDLEPSLTLGVHSHVHPEQRERALAAGFDLVVPRSRMAREGPALVDGLAARRRRGGTGA